MTFTKISGPTWLSVAANGNLSGTPINSNVGLNTFIVSVTDGNTAPVQATVNITVINTNDAPTFTQNPIYTPPATRYAAYPAASRVTPRTLMWEPPWSLRKRAVRRG